MSLRDQRYAEVRRRAKECEEAERELRLAMDRARRAGCAEGKSARELLAGREEGRT